MKYLSIFVVLLVISFFSCNRVTEKMPDFEVHGIDVSHYQSAIDWPAVAAEGIDFGFVKATEGQDMQDSIFCENWQAMRTTGIVRGAYHFFRPGTSAVAQARHFIETVHLEYGDLPPVLDIEVLDEVSPNLMVTRLKIWLEMVELAYGIRPIIYTNMKYYNQHLADHFPDYKVWIARYSNSRPSLLEQRDWDFWQYGNRGQIPGIDGPVDLNVFQGTYQDLETLTYSPFSSPSTAGR